MRNGKVDAASNGAFDVVLPVMPFAELATPSIAPSLLKAEIAGVGFSSQVRYFNLDFAALVGVQRYRQISGEFSPRVLLGERIFADILFQGQLPKVDEYAAKLGEEYPGRLVLIRHLLKALLQTAEFVQNCADEIRRLHPRVVAFVAEAFSTKTYQQTCASLAVAARLKQCADPPVIAFGGPNCEGEMGLQFLRSFPWIDYVCTGEADVVFPAFLQRLLRDGVAGPLPGLLKQGETSAVTVPALVREMDKLPMPDYADYFAQLKPRPSTADMDRVALLIQTSRGCWWGAKQHCTFCGLNDQTMIFRSKSPEAVMRELTHLIDRYGARKIYCIDNILDLTYLRTLFPKLIARRSRVKLFYETKANLTFEQLATLRAGGVCWIQPGIESFSDQVLDLMQKGTTTLKNIRLLRWCRELEIEPLWNILYGFPGESPSEYACMAKLLPLLTHLDPPQACGPIRLCRFSPYFNQPEAFGLREVRADSYYRYVFPLPEADLNRLAYYFEFEWPGASAPNEYTHALRRVVREWKTSADVSPKQRPRLDLREKEGGIVITDTRPCAVRRVHPLAGLAAEIYLRCDTPETLSSLALNLSHQASASEVRRELRRLQKAKLLVERDGHHLSLAVWRHRGVSH